MSKEHGGNSFYPHNHKYYKISVCLCSELIITGFILFTLLILLYHSLRFACCRYRVGSNVRSMRNVKQIIDNCLRPAMFYLLIVVACFDSGWFYITNCIKNCLAVWALRSIMHTKIVGFITLKAAPTVYCVDKQQHMFSILILLSPVSMQNFMKNGSAVLELSNNKHTYSQTFTCIILVWLGARSKL